MVAEAKSFAFVDNNPMYKSCKIDGYNVIDGDEVGNYDKENMIIIITANGFNDGVAHNIAEDLSMKYGLREGKHFFIYEVLINTLIRHSFNLTYKLDNRSTASISRNDDLWRILPK
jgi:hypothetical protein